jgi:hypothetical protein
VIGPLFSLRGLCGYFFSYEKSLEFETRKAGDILAPSQTGMVAAGGIFEVVIKDPSLPVTESNLDVGGPSQDSRIPLLHHHTGSPFRIAMVDHPIPDFQV